MKVRFFWLDGTTNVLEGENLPKIVRNATCGNRRMDMLDFYITDVGGRDLENHGYVFSKLDGWLMDWNNSPYDKEDFIDRYFA